MNTDIAASFTKPIGVVAVVLCSTALFLNTASAQFGYGLSGRMNLPQSDFTWTWGDERSAGRGIDDFSVLGNEAGFRCDLTGKLRFGSRLSRNDVRALESDLQGSLYFIQAAANTMYALDAQAQLEWATLVCTRPEPSENDQAKQDERKARALERIARQAERERARRQQEEEEEANTP